ncbi:hypothetical protein K5D33_16290 [Pseudomonas cichorii]|nr:hypothetical protein [Pseudomonas cichorii]MBX8536260.1 hypothetical protein [Pseudomonas cichorii]
MKEKIEELSQNLRDILRNKEGGLELRAGSSDRVSLFKNGIKPHTLNFDELITLGSELGKNLSFAKRGCFTTFDHSLFWSWTAAILLDFIPGTEPDIVRQDSDLSSLLSTSMCSALRVINVSPSLNCPELNGNITAHLGFPLIETLSRKTLNEYLTPEGIVIKPFPSNKGTDYKEGRRCSSMADALSFAITIQKNPLLQIKLKQLIDDLEIFAKNEDSGIDFLNILRNEALHAARTASTIGGVLLTIGLLLCLGLVEDRYDELHRKISSKILFGKNGHLSGWAYQYNSLSSLSF